MASMSSLLDNIRERGSEIHRDAVAVMADELDSQVPVKTGELRSSQQVKASLSRGQVLSSTIEYPSDVASFLEDGTRPHLITGNPLLVFFWPRVGRVVFFRHVNHPGSTKRKGWFSKIMRRPVWTRALKSAQ